MMRDNASIKDRMKIKIVIILVVVRKQDVDGLNNCTCMLQNVLNGRVGINHKHASSSLTRAGASCVKVCHLRRYLCVGAPAHHN